MTDASKGSVPPMGYELIAEGTDTATLSQPVAMFRSFYDARVTRELVLDFAELCSLIVPLPVRPRSKKEFTPCFSLAKYIVAPYIGRTADKFGPGPGKQRSNDHLVKMGPGIAFDIDSVPAQEMSRRIQALGLAHIAFTSHSSGLPEPEENKVAGRGRLVVFLNGTWEPREHAGVCATINKMVLNGVADDGAFAAPQPFAVHCTSTKTPDQPTFHHAQHGLQLSLEKIRALMPKPSAKPSGRPPKVARTNSDLILREAQEIGAMGAVDEEPYWMTAMNCIRRTWSHPNDPQEAPELALNVADAMSQAAANYKGRADVEAKMNRTDGKGHTKKFDYVQQLGKACATAVIERAHTQADNVVRLRQLGTPSSAFAQATLPEEKLDDGLSPGMKVPKSLSTAPDNVKRAVLYLARWHPPQVIDELVGRFPALAQFAAEIERRKAERAAQIQADEQAEREIVAWNRNNASKGVDNIVDGLLGWAMKTTALWTMGDAIWRRTDAPGSEQFRALAEHDEYLEMTDEAICYEHVIPDEEDPNDHSKWQYAYNTVDFLSGTPAQKGPNLSRFKIVVRRLRDQLPRVAAFINTPAFDGLPNDYKNLGEPHIVDQPGYDPKSGFYLLQGGASVKVPLDPAPQEISNAADTLIDLLSDFDFEDGASKLAGYVGLFIAALRGSLGAAPIFGALGRTRGQASGKNTLSEMLIALATGEHPSIYLMTLGADTAETNKNMFRSLREKPLGLLISNLLFEPGQVFRSAKLCELATSGVIEGILLYLNTKGRLLCRPFLAINGNDVPLHADFGERLIACWLKEPKKHPDGTLVDRNYKHSDLIGYVLENRSRIVSAVMTIVTIYWRVCQQQEGRPPNIEHLCKGRSTRFKQHGVDFILDCVTWLSSGKYGSAYSTFAHRGEGTADDERDAFGRELVEQAMAALSRPATTTSVGAIDAPTRAQVTKSAPATLDEIWSGFGWPSPPSPQRLSMGTILNRRNPRVDWSPKSLGDWLRGQLGKPGAGTDVLQVTPASKPATYWFGPRDQVEPGSGRVLTR